MKKTGLIIFLFLSVTCYAVDVPDSLYYLANEKYKAGEYENAIDLYSRVEEQGYESSELYYNMGNAYYRSNKIGKSRLYYEKALKLDPSNEDARHNLAFTGTLIVDKIENVPDLFLRRWIKSLLHLAASDTWALIAMITFVVSLVMFSIYLLVRNISLRKYGFYSGLILIMISAAAFVFSWKQLRNESDPSTAIIIQALVNVKSTPRETGTDLFVLHEGAKVWLEDSTADWQEIRLSDGRKGWLHSSAIEKI